MATYTISGNISPVSLVNTDSTIVMANAPGNANYYQGTVNLDGTYSIPSLPDATTYKVQVTGSNFLTSVASITVPISGANVTGIDFIAVLAPSVGIFAPMFSDSFQRANELPLSDGGNWINLGSLPTKDQLQILNNQCETTVTVTRDGTAYYRDTGIVLPNDQYCSVTITELGINGLIWLYVRGTDGASTPALEQNYNVFIYGGGGGGSAFSVSAIDTGGSNIPYAWVGYQPYLFSINDVITFAIAGQGAVATLYLFQNGTCIWQGMVAPNPDGVYASGTVGLQLNATLVTDAGVINFVSGGFSVINESGGQTGLQLSMDASLRNSGLRH